VLQSHLEGKFDFILSLWGAFWNLWVFTSLGTLVTLEESQGHQDSAHLRFHILAPFLWYL
jgi:hypothetical protein